MYVTVNESCLILIMYTHMMHIYEHGNRVLSDKGSYMCVNTMRIWLLQHHHKQQQKQQQLTATSRREHVTEIADIWDSINHQLLHCSSIKRPCRVQVVDAHEARVIVPWVLNVTACLVYQAQAATTEDCMAPYPRRGSVS